MARSIKKSKKVSKNWSLLSFRTFLIAATLSGITGSYLILQGNAQNTNIGKPVKYPNPVLSQTCGLDIALALDLSDSMTSDQQTQIKNAAVAFNSAFQGTATRVSVTKFGDSAVVARGFTEDTAATNNSINAADTVKGESRWEHALNEANGTFDPRPSNQNLIMIITGDKVQNESDVDKSKAITNDLKKNGTRIVMVGVTQTPSFFTKHWDQFQNLARLSGTEFYGVSPDNPGEEYTQNDSTLLKQDILISAFYDLPQRLERWANLSCNKIAPGPDRTTEPRLRDFTNDVVVGNPGQDSSSGSRSNSGGGGNSATDPSIAEIIPLSDGTFESSLRAPTFTIGSKEFFIDDILATITSVGKTLLRMWPVTILGTAALIGATVGLWRWRHSKPRIQ